MIPRRTKKARGAPYEEGALPLVLRSFRASARPSSEIVRRKFVHCPRPMTASGPSSQRPPALGDEPKKRP